MANIETIIAILPKFLRKKSDSLSDSQLASLDQILTTLEQRTNLRDDMTTWFVSLSKAEKDALNVFASGNREISNQSAPPDNIEAEIRQNLFEACQVLENQKKKENSPSQDS